MTTDRLAPRDELRAYLAGTVAAGLPPVAAESLLTFADAMVAATREPLDAAWAEVEAALPQSTPPWMLALRTYVHEPDGEPFVEACAYAPMYEDAVQVFGPTPAAALLALAAALRKPVTA